MNNVAFNVAMDETTSVFRIRKYNGMERESRLFRFWRALQLNSYRIFPSQHQLATQPIGVLIIDSIKFRLSDCLNHSIEDLMEIASSLRLNRWLNWLLIWLSGPFFGRLTALFLWLAQSEMIAKIKPHGRSPKCLWQ